MVNQLEQLFLRLQPGGYQITSPAHRLYNCIAWAAGESSIWWWPLDEPGVFWPPGVPLEATLDAFRQAFAALGYEVSGDEQPESAYEKIAIFAGPDGVPSHAARQLPTGRWTSKLGVMEDIEHALHDVEGDVYGAVVQLMKRPVPSVPRA